MTTIVFDLETKDPYLKELGAGWATDTGKVLLGSAIVDSNVSICKYKNDIVDSLVSTINQGGTTLVAHNASYDIGWLWKDIVDHDNFTLVDTIHMAKLFNNEERSYSLEHLAQRYLGVGKTQNELLEYCKDKKGLPKTKNTVMANLDLLPQELVMEYCAQDVRLTNDLYNFYLDKLDLAMWEDWQERLSNCLKAFVGARMRGVPVDRKRLFQVAKILKVEKEKIYSSITTDIGGEINLNSSAQIAEMADKFNIPYGKTEKGNPSVDKFWMAEQTHPICEKIKEYKRYDTAYNNFCVKLIKQQRLLPRHKRGFIYPHINIFGAARTGRMSSQSPNIQQVPAKDEEIGPLIRSIYTARDEMQWLSVDFSSQEIVLALHFASKVCPDMVDTMIDKYKHDLDFDFHGFGATLCGLERKEAKAITLGKMYGMGVAKLAQQMGITQTKARDILRKYDRALPFMRKIMTVCSDVAKQRGYVKTILGRRLKTERGYEYKSLNKVIQGSAADQTYEAVSQCWKEKVPIFFPVHDEINFPLPFASKMNGEYITLRTDIMDHSLDLNLPMRSEAGLGKNWADAK